MKPICRSMSQALMNAARSMVSTKRSLVSSSKVLRRLEVANAEEQRLVIDLEALVLADRRPSFATASLAKSTSRTYFQS